MSAETPQGESNIRPGTLTYIPHLFLTNRASQGGASEDVVLRDLDRVELVGA
jgi:hypothetical protein